MAIRDCSFLDKDVEQKSKELEAYVERMLTRGRKEGAKEKAQRTALDVCAVGMVWGWVFVDLGEHFQDRNAFLVRAIAVDAVDNAPCDSVVVWMGGWRLGSALY